MKNILVTGGAGFIGSITTLTLIQKGYKVTVIDSYVNSSEIIIKRIKNIINSQCPKYLGNFDNFKGDLRDKSFLEDVFIKKINQGINFDGVIHFAGLKSVKDSITNPIEYWSANIEGTINLIDSMEKFNCKKLIFSSSATIYSLNNNKLINENSRLQPINPYGNTKYVAEIFLSDVFKSQSDKWSIINLRYFNPIGAHNSGLLGENPIVKPNNIFPIINKVALGEIEKLEIYGNDWNTPDGTCIRDYIHIMDLSEGHVLALEHLFENAPDFINLNLGTGQGISVLELINNFEKINNVKIPYVFVKRREGDLACTVADNSLANKLLNWIPEKNIEDMCKDGWKWTLTNNEY